ncbi:MAG: arsenate reductase [Pyrinomonadaceae bacterium]|nr:arsenate reductase [Pyrinomonadaceae bacterium]
MPEQTILYWLPHCTTCQKADQHLTEIGHAVALYRDLKTEPLTRAEVEGLAEIAGGAGELFSRRARKYRAMNLHERELSDDDMIELMTNEYTFIKRPVLVQGARAVAGLTAKSYERFFGES